jgi:hypothetical protein
VASSRYRLPLMPLWIVLAGVWLAHPVWPASRARTVAIAVGLAAWGLLAGHYVATVLP